MNNLVAMGRCGECLYRDINGYCQNIKLSENFYQKSDEIDDMLIYSYQEGGGFWVGPQFGCVHYAEMSNEQP